MIIAPYRFAAAEDEDPLTGIDFALRLQTHNGDNVPLGLYQDVSCTIPATMDGDPIAAWRDELGTSGLIATQSDEQRQPILVFEDGVPTVLFDAVDDYLRAAFTLAFPAHTFAAARWDAGDGTGGPTLFDGASVNTMRLYRTTATTLNVYAQGTGPAQVTTPEDFHVHGVLFRAGSGQSSFRVDGGAENTGGDLPGTPNPDGVIIGEAGDATSGPFGGAATAFLVSLGALSPSDRVVTEDFLATLIP